MVTAMVPVSTSALQLRPLRLADEAAVHAAQRALAPDNFDFAFDLDSGTDWPAYFFSTALNESSKTCRSRTTAFTTSSAAITPRLR